jgi:hypothetical protein
MKNVLCFNAIVGSILLVSYSGSSSSHSSSTDGGSSPVTRRPFRPLPEVVTPSHNRQAQIDSCSMFSPKDAQAITGVPMKFSPGHGPIVCMYEETTPQLGLDIARVIFNAQHREVCGSGDKGMEKHERTPPAEDREKNIAQLSGNGDEAWLDGHVEKGKVGLGGILVREGKADFTLQSAMMQYRASLEKARSTHSAVLAQRG